MKKILYFLILMFASIYLFGCTTNEGSRIGHTSDSSQKTTTDSSNRTSVSEPISNFQLLQFIDRFQISGEYKKVIHNFEELEQHNREYPLEQFDKTQLRENYFDNHSIIIISFNWANTEPNFWIDRIQQNENGIEIVINYEEGNVVGFVITHKVFIIEVNKSLLGTVNDITYRLNKIDVTQPQELDYQLLYFIDRLQLSDEYIKVIHNLEELEQHNKQYLNDYIEKTHFDENYFDNHSMILISFNWADTETNFWINHIQQLENRLEIFINYEYGNIVGRHHTHKLFVIEINKALIGNTNDLNYHLNKIEDSQEPYYYKLFHFINRMETSNEYKKMIHNFDELEQHNIQYPNDQLDITHLEDNYFDNHSIIVISFIWRNTQDHFWINQIQKTESGLDITINYEETPAFDAMTQKVIFIEIDKELTHYVKSLTYNFNPVYLGLPIGYSK